MLNKRGFLKIASALVGGLTLSKYTNAEFFVSEKKVSAFQDWIEDRGDFYVVTIPDFKSFSNEILNKPTVFLAGHNSSISRIRITGFVNIHSKNGHVLLTESEIDVTQHAVDCRRYVIEASGYSGIELSGCHIKCPENNQLSGGFSLTS